MKYTLATQLRNLDGTPIKTPAPESEVVTFKSIATRCLLAPSEKATGEDKYACFKLAVKIETASESGDVDLTAEEAARIRKLVGENMPPIIVGRMYELLDQLELPEKK